MGGRRKTSFAALVLVGALGISACGGASGKISSGTYAGGGGAEAPYLEVGPLIYEVQISRALNPYMREDEPYLDGFSAGEREPKPGEEWFAVFMQVYNRTLQPHKAASEITISDTQGNTYKPVTLPATNLFAYRGGVIPPRAQIPPVGGIADEGPTQGALLLYKIQLASLDNRPLTIKIVDTETHEKAEAELDT